ncbi:MAG: M20/M25/M40 family metallo-hydrolase [Deltaproteobacteria bacterium]|jgi:amidohydrolase|nr:M20/M25/M40 family metallo-hydrolase [Deltaproteobacteria bacterium]
MAKSRSGGIAPSLRGLRKKLYNLKQLSSLPHAELSRPTPGSAPAVIKGAAPGKCLVLRADIDALPLRENSGESFSSVNEGIMHVCGHDAHAAMLMGAVKALYGMRDEILGNDELR